jgi:hypothetical protein
MSMNRIRILNRFEHNPYGGHEFDVTSRSLTNSDLSPFKLGPFSVAIFPGHCTLGAKQIFQIQNFENFWQYSKVYPGYAYAPADGDTGNPFKWTPSPDYYAWRNMGWRDKWAKRYPLGKGKKPFYSLFDGVKMDYVRARKIIYAHHYGFLIQNTPSFAMLKNLHDAGNLIVLRDFDGYDHIRMNMSLIDVINNPNRSMGHAFVIAMVLQNCLMECIAS